jgi:peptidoglycan/LPS O-acetylase OafA/YrhL
MSSRYNHLDFLRSSAVMLVFFAHFTNTVATTARTGLGSAAHFGVLMFFVHTSLVLGMSWDRLPSGSRIGKFYVRRIFRIYPLAVITVLFMLFAGLPPALWLSSFHPTRGAVLANLFLVQNLTGSRDILATMWSLPFEIQMYIVLPALFAFRNRIHALVLWGAAVVLSEFLLAIRPPAGEIVRYAPCFCAGLVAYRLVRENRPVRVPFRLMPVALVAGLVAFVVVDHFAGFTAIADSVAALGVGALTGLMNGYVPPVLSRICAEIAKYSYGIYLSHLPIMMICLGPARTPARYAGFAVLAIAVPILLYHTIERPMIVAGTKVSDLIGRRMSARQALANSAAV